MAKKSDWKSQALAAINKVYPNASERTKKNLLANIAHETGNGAFSTEIPMKWKNMDTRSDIPTIKGKVNAYMKKHNLSKSEYDKLPASDRISIQYQGKVGSSLSGGVGALQTTDVSGDKIKLMREVGRELGFKNDKSILRNTASNMYNSAIFSLSVMKKEGITAEDLNSQVSALDLRKKYINPGETSKKHLDSVSKYEREISSSFKSIEKLDPDSDDFVKKINSNDTSVRKDFNDGELYSNYKKYKEELDGLDKNSKEYNDNVFAVQQKWQDKVGTENLRKGADLVNEEKKYVLENENKDFLAIKKLDKEFADLSKKSELQNKLGPLTTEEKASLDNYKSKRNAYLAKIRISANDNKIKEAENIIEKADFNSNEYKNAVKLKNDLTASNNKIYSGFKVVSKPDMGRAGGSSKLDDSNLMLRDEENVASILTSGSVGSNINIKNYYDTSSYNGDISDDLTDLYGYEKYDGNGQEDNYTPESNEDSEPRDFIDDEEIDDNKSNEDYNPTTPDGDGQKDTTKQFDFTTKIDGEGLESTPPSMFQEDLDAMEEQSAGGFLKENPTSILSAALGIKGLVDSQSDIPDMAIEDKTQLSEGWYEHLNKLEEISKKGFTPEEEAAYRKQINDGYMASVNLAVQASGGNRATVLQQSGKFNANKNDANLNYSAQDAQLHRENLDNYGKALQYTDAFDERKDIRRQTNEYNEKTADFNQAIQKRQGGAALAAGSIKSLVDSISTYKETGPGSPLYNLRKFTEKQILNSQTAKDANGNVLSKDDYYKGLSDRTKLAKDTNKASIDFDTRIKGAGLTTEQLNVVEKNLKGMDYQNQYDYFQRTKDIKSPQDYINQLKSLEERNGIEIPKNIDVPEETNMDRYNGFLS